MLHSEYTAIMQAVDQEEFLSKLVCFTHRLGFETVTAMVVIDHSLADAEFFTVDNTPEAWRAGYSDPEAVRRDPVLQHCKYKNLPIVWGKDTYTTAGQGTDWEEMAGHGYCTGIAMALHLPEGRHFMLGVDRDKALPTDPTELLRRVADVQLLTAYAQEAAMRILAPVPEEAALPSFNRHELDTLRWTMEGKTAEEVGAVLGISGRTTVMHLNHAMRKLGCGSKHQAVLKALRLGLLR